MDEKKGQINLLTGELEELPPPTPYMAARQHAFDGNDSYTIRLRKRAEYRIAQGFHPFGMRLKEPRGETCKDCLHATVGGGGSGFWKCGLARQSHSPATDLRLKWPACDRFQPKPVEPPKKKQPAFRGPIKFDGPAYDEKADKERLTGQCLRVFEAMRDGQWRTLDEIRIKTNDPPASISAQLRHLRKPRFGGYVVNKRRRGEAESGLWEYRLLQPTNPQPKGETHGS